VGHVGEFKQASAVAYIRVSSRAQDHATQRTSIERMATARGDEVSSWFAEKRSAKTMEREELQRLLAEARSGRLRGRRLYVFRLDRLTRTGIADTLTTLETFRTHGVEVVSIADGFDLQGPHAEVIVAVMAWAAKMERLATAERISAARERIEGEGGHWGRPSRLGQAEVTQALAMRSEGRSVRAIAVAMKIPRATIARALAAASQKPTPREGGDPPAEEAPQQGSVK
jgi:DNA invertase Pin-like site-specific DNA recombinase